MKFKMSKFCVHILLLLISLAAIESSKDTICTKCAPKAEEEPPATVWQPDVCYYFDPKAKKRVPMPAAASAPKGSDTLVIDGEELQATRHHIIPMNTLRNFFNKAHDVHDFSKEMNEFLASRITAIVKYFAEHPSVGAFSGGKAPGIAAPFNTDPNVRMLCAFAWMPGNLFYGPPPHLRADDRGDRLDVAARQITGNKAFEVLSRLDENMGKFINDKNFRTTENFDKIMLDVLAVATSRDSPYGFIESDWEPVLKKKKKMFRIIRAQYPKAIEPNPQRKVPRRKGFPNAPTATNGEQYSKEDYLKSAQAVCETLTKAESTAQSPKKNSAGGSQVKSDDRGRQGGKGRRG